MPQIQPPSRLYRVFMALDSVLSSTGYEAMDSARRIWANYSAFIDRFHVPGFFGRGVVELVSDGASLGLLFAIGVLYYALPPFSGTGDIWNRGRQYAVTVTDAGGQIVGRRGIRQDDAIALDEIPPILIKATLATEDFRFYEHFGLDIQGTARALVENVRANDVVQGGSTLTQQLAKNLFLSPERSLRRKLHEAFLALWIEVRLSKDEILKLYLDRSYLGGGAYGVEAAAQFYFGKSIRDVNLAEAALLAGLFKAPSKFAPHINLEAARTRTNVVLSRMLDVGYITQGELFAASKEPARIVNQQDYYSPDWYLDYAYEETLAILKEHGLESEYVIEVKSTVDVALQRHAQAAVNEMLDTEAPAVDASQAALVALEPSGALKAMVGGRNYEESQFNRATEALRQPGSAFKPFVYLAALRSGYKPNTVVYDVPIAIGNWAPQNYNRRFTGRTTLITALTHSINTIPVHIAQAIGRQKIIETAHLVGLDAELLAVPSMPLGANAVTVLDMTGAFATFANGGKLATPFTVLEIRRPNGDLLYSRERNAPEVPQVVAEREVADLNLMLNSAVLNGTGKKAILGYTPQAGKTGTTTSYRDAWFLGYTGHLVTGVWFGNDDYHSMERVTGGSIPAKTWKKFMDKALETRVAAALPGVPVDPKHVAFARAGEDDLELPLSPTAPGVISSASPGTADVAVARPPQRDGVVRVLKDMFSLFSRNPEPRVRAQPQRTFVFQQPPPQRGFWFGGPSRAPQQPTRQTQPAREKPRKPGFFGF